MNKRGGSIAILALFIIAIALEGGALFVMFWNNYDYGDKSRYISEMMNEGDFAKEYVIRSATEILSESANCKEEVYGDICSLEINDRIKSIAVKKDIKYLAVGNFFFKISKGEFEIEEKEGKSVFIMRDVFVLSEREGNKVKKNFNVSIEFDDKGKQ